MAPNLVFKICYNIITKKHNNLEAVQYTTAKCAEKNSAKRRALITLLITLQKYQKYNESRMSSLSDNQKESPGHWIVSDLNVLGES